MTVYAETREQSGTTIYCRSRITTWDGWPDDVVEILRGWNKDRRLRFVGMDTIGRTPPQPSFKCPDCYRFVNASGSTAAKLDGVLVCDDCVILRARQYGPLGRPETELEKAKRWQRNMQVKLARYRHNALSEAEWVKLLTAVVEAAWDVDRYLSEGGPPFKFDNKRISTEAEIALLILHDTLNDVEARRQGVDRG